MTHEIDDSNIDKYLLEYVEISENLTMDSTKNDDEWKHLTSTITIYYKNKIREHFIKNGEVGKSKIYEDIIDTLYKNNRYKNQTGIIVFNVTDFTKKLK